MRTQVGLASVGGATLEDEDLVLIFEILLKLLGFIQILL